MNGIDPRIADAKRLLPFFRVNVPICPFDDLSHPIALDLKQTVLFPRFRFETQNDQCVVFQGTCQLPISAIGDQGDVTQRIQVLEGNAAFIHTGQSVPVGERNVFHGPGGTTIQDSVRYRDVTTGFYVYPRVNGDRVILRISPQKQNLSPEGGGRIDVQTAETTVSGRLGQWIDLGGTSGVSETQGSGITYRTAERDSRYGSIQVKVEEIKD